MNECSEELILFERNRSMSQLEFFGVGKVREVSVDGLLRDFVQRVRAPLGLAVTIDKHRSNALVEVGVFTESTNEP